MSSVRAIRLQDIPANNLGSGSWSRILITQDHVDGNHASLGVSLFTPGTVSQPIAHAVEELVYVTRGQGELRTDGGPVHFVPGDALFVPPGVWHWVANTGSEDVEMIFSFPSPGYPQTERR
jgi:quercetin dioxygenase-like cupin family protein